MFKTQNFCHIASNNRNQVKVGVFVYRTTDNLATVLTSGYFNDRIIDINLHDLIIHEKVDSADATKVERNLLCVTERTLENVGTSIIKNKWEGDIEQAIADLQTYVDATFVRKDGTSVMTAPLKFSAGSMRGAVGSFLNGVSFWKMDSQGTITNIANLTDSQFSPVTTNSINLGNGTHIWKDAYVARVITSVLNNGYDIAVPVTNSADTLALKSQVDLAANSGRMITDQGVWYAKMYAGTTAPAAEDGTNYADFSQTDNDGNPIIVIYERTSGAWVLSETITPPAEYDGYVPITSKIWDIAEQAGQQGGRVLWNHQSKEFTPYPQIVSFDNIEVTGESTVIIPNNPIDNQIVNKKFVEDAVAGAHYHPDLLDHKWSDYILNDMQWLRADTFSWQDGTVYENAYQHLVDDLGQRVYGWSASNYSRCYTTSEEPQVGDDVYTYSGSGVPSTPVGTVTAVAADYSSITFGGAQYNRSSVYDTYFNMEQDTVNGINVFYFLAADGHKICPAYLESNVAAIYAATGVAWYYIIDTVNERFKLPRVNPDKELLMQTSPVVGNGQTIAFNATQNGVNLQDKELIVNRYDYGGNISVQRTMLLDQNIPDTSTASALTWSRSGLVADLTSATGIYEGKKYLYFYVGNFTQTALENTAGLNAELFNGKADTDLSNLTSTGKEKLGSKVYVASGMLFNSSGDTCEGYGTVTVSLYPNGIARIDFNIKFTTSGTSSSNFTCGLNRDLISYINSNIPRITPTTGGSLTYYTTSGSIADSKMNYGGIMIATGQFWQPGRVYDTSGSIGGFPAVEYVANQRIIGVCYGKYSV